MALTYFVDPKFPYNSSLSNPISKVIENYNNFFLEVWGLYPDEIYVIILRKNFKIIF